MWIVQCNIPLSGHLLTSWNRVILRKLTVAYEIFDIALSQTDQLRTLTSNFLNICFNIILLFEVRISDCDFKTLIIWRLYFLRLQSLNTIFSIQFTFPSSVHVLLSPDLINWAKFEHFLTNSSRRGKYPHWEFVETHMSLNMAQVIKQR